MTWRGYETRTLPTIQRTLSDLLCCIFLQEVLYFYNHRFLHTPLMFKYHKLHHQWHSPIAITAAYCHPVEHLTANLFPMLMGPLVLGSHLSTTWIWISMATAGTLFLHSGFHILPLPTSEFHDYHHEKKHHNFGIWGLMDRLYGTNGCHHSDKVH
ncbi:Fatty acid hydroxylase domain-containing protein 2 [Araneus ventricosus]|uniref:Fatty acid hydroxylase domain-containing protein 2 n=1 Tax=Araneus ventricosus TaxID=182803 RepID=A0A4Y2G1R6_ARAVE|nr:Fatty acid hydroxylase domain-containing protein 2 [Araneus ventricosus]